MALFPTNYHEDERGWPSPRLKSVHGYTPVPTQAHVHAALDRILPKNPCEVGLAPKCSRREEGYGWQGKPCCVQCLSFMEQNADAKRELTAAENLDARR